MKIKKRRNLEKKAGWKRGAVCGMYCFSDWKGKLVLFCSGAHNVLRNRKPGDLPILMDSWCPPIAGPLFLLATVHTMVPTLIQATWKAAQAAALCSLFSDMLSINWTATEHVWFVSELCP